MLLLSLLAGCGEPDCGFGFLPDGEGGCVPTPDQDDDTGVPPDDTGDPGPTGTLACDGLHVVSSTPVAKEACGVCDGVACTWTVLTALPVGSVELDLRHEAPVDEDEPWTEYHDGFSVVESTAVREVRSAVLAQVDELGDYASGVSTWVHLDDPDTLAALSLQVSVNDPEGVYLDCFAWGFAPEAFTGDCPVVAE